MAAASVLEFFLLANGTLDSLREIVQDLFSKKIDPDKPPPQFEAKVVPVFTQIDGLEKLDDRTKILIALVNRLLPNALKDAKEFNHLQALFNVSANTLAQKKEGAEIPNFDVFAVEDKKFFDLEAGEPPAKVVDAVKDWIETKYIPNTELRHLAALDDRETIKNIVRFTSGHIGGLNPIVSDVVEQRTVVNLGIIEYPSTESQYFKLYKVDLHAWVEKITLGGGVYTKYKCGLRGEFNSYGFEPRPSEDFDRLSEETKQKMLVSFDAFAKELPTQVKKPAIKPLGYDGQAETLTAFRTNASIAELDSLF